MNKLLKSLEQLHDTMEKERDRSLYRHISTILKMCFIIEENQNKIFKELRIVYLFFGMITGFMFFIFIILV